MSCIFIVTGKEPYSDGTRYPVKAFRTSEQAWSFAKDMEKKGYYFDTDVVDCELADEEKDDERNA